MSLNAGKVVAKGKLAVYLIEDAEIRQSLMDDIAELDAFCHGRRRKFLSQLLKHGKRMV